MTIREALASGTAALKASARRGIETPGLDASLLLAEVLGVSRRSLLSAGPDPLTEESLAAFNSLIKRRLDGECTACILGKKEFYGLEFLVNHSVLVPRPETETLVEAALSFRPSAPHSPRLLDLCTGSGAVAVALKHEMPGLEVRAADISAEALETAKANAARLLPPESVRFYRGNLFEALPVPNPRPLFHIIVSNPPYIPSAEIAGLSPEVRAEPAIALDGGVDGLDIIRKIIAQAPGFLYPGGMLLLEADPRQMADAAALFEENGFIDIKIYKDLSGRERVIGGVL